MTVTFGNRFRSNPNNLESSAGAEANKRPPAKFWLNVGYATDDETYPFVALPLGIPLDLSDQKELRGKPEFVAFTSAQNDLLAQLVAEAETLQPGEDRIFEHPGCPLAFQIRHVRGEQQAMSPENNPLARRVFG